MRKREGGREKGEKSWFRGAHVQSDLSILAGLHINPSSGQLHGHPLSTPGHHVIHYTIKVYSECCPTTISSCSLKMRIVEAKVTDKAVKKEQGTNVATADEGLEQACAALK